MSRKLFATTLVPLETWFLTGVAILLVITLVTPTAFFVAPQRASAESTVSCLGGAAVGLFSFFLPPQISGIRVTAPSAETGIGATAVSTIGECVNEIVLKPLARAMIRLVLQQVTASIINWINNTPGTGRPSFVMNLTLHLQSLGDAVALPFINQVRTALNPQFGAAIASSLLTNYALGTSVGGFLAGNQSTLARVSPNPGAFLAGNWSKGGIPAWFELTTKNQNNPYMLYPAAQSELQKLVNQAQTNRRQDLSQSGGFLSWCGNNSTSASACVANSDGTCNTSVGCFPDDEAPTGCSRSGAGINPGASCIDSNGKQVNAQTPGTVIRDYTKEVLTADIAQLIDPNDINAALVAIFQAAINQGIKGITTSLFSASETSSARPQAITSQLYNSATSNLNATQSANSIAQAKLSQINDYTTAWGAIGTAANSALGSATSLKNNPSCASQAGAADTAIGEATSVVNQAQAAQSSVSATRDLALRVQEEATSNPTRAVTDAQTLQTMPPSAAQVASAEQEARTTLGGVTANPAGSLAVSGGTLFDRMNLMSVNANALNANNCATP